MLENAIYGRLSGYSGLSALVGTRIYPEDVPETGSYPAVRYHLLGAYRISAMGEDTGDVKARVQFDCLADTYAAAVAVRAQLRAAMQRFRGTVAGVEIQNVFIENEEAGYDDNAEKFAPSLDLIIWYKE